MFSKSESNDGQTLTPGVFEESKAKGDEPNDDLPGNLMKSGVGT